MPMWNIVSRSSGEPLADCKTVVKFPPSIKGDGRWPFGEITFEVGVLTPAQLLPPVMH